ncbi:MAG: PDZ domain-containing protein [Akkermansia sp.]|nr:PDZ domain-containing protein [Akkermansia sp.]
MIRTLTILSLTALLLSACKPTERTALKKKQAELAAAPATPEVEQPVVAEPTPLPTPPEPAPLPEPVSQEPSASLLVVSSTVQGYNPLRPWEKEEPRQLQALGVYLGEGRVLTPARVVNDATYVELMLPDASRSVPARVLRFDEEMNLALLTVVHEADASVFETRTALPLGEALNRGDAATYAGLINGVEPVHVELQAENAAGDKVPLMVMRAARPLPEGQTNGAPVVREGKLCAVGVSYRKQEHLMQVVNAELIERFLTQEEAGVPVVGVQLTPLDDPLFRKYLKLDDAANGLYVSKVLPGSAAQAAGVQVGDVITAIEGLPIDNQGRCNHPRYGLHSASVLLRGMKDRGQELALTVSRAGEVHQIAVNLNRDAVEHALFRPQKSGVQPRYVMWGGLLFQPLTSTLVETLTDRNKGMLPLELQTLTQNQETLRQSGCTEPVALTFVLPTAATQGYEEVYMSRLVAVNGKPVNCFADLPALLDEQTENGLVALEFNKPPYTIYVERQAADAVNSYLQQKAIPKLRVVEE